MKGVLSKILLSKVFCNKYRNTIKSSGFINGYRSLVIKYRFLDSSALNILTDPGIRQGDDNGLATDTDDEKY